MSSRFTSLLSLLFIFGILFAAYWFVFKDKTPASDSPIPTASQISFVAVDASQLQEFMWTYGSTRGVLQRTESSQWKLREPSISTDNDKASLFVSGNVNITGQSKYPFSEVSKEDAGLVAPEVTITYTLKDGSTEKVYIGKKTIDGDFHYATKDGIDYSTLISSYIVDDLKKDPYSLSPSATQPPVATP